MDKVSDLKLCGHFDLCHIRIFFLSESICVCGGLEVGGLAGYQVGESLYTSLCLHGVYSAVW